MLCYILEINREIELRSHGIQASQIIGQQGGVHAHYYSASLKSFLGVRLDSYRQRALVHLDRA
jgi:hypothetical protein